MSVFSRSAQPERRVVVTGMGIVCPTGNNLSSTWENICAGRSGIGPITQFDASAQDVHFAGEVKNFDASTIMEKKEIKKMDRFIHFAMACADMAIKDSGIVWNEKLLERTGSIVGVGIGGLPGIEAQHTTLMERGPSRISPFFIPMVISNMASGQISIKHGLKGPNYSVTSACASGAHSLGESVEYIRRGICDVMISGGAEAAVSPLAMSGFASMRALSTRNDAPEKASRPFDRDRDGFVMSEAGAILVLEDYETAAARGARIYCEVTGYGVSSDAYHMTNPAPGGDGAARAMRMALANARLNPSDLSYVNAHGTSTPVGDEMETLAIHSVFKDHAKKLWVSSTKSMTGHTLGAAGAIESVFSIMAIKDQVAPPTINLENPSPNCDLDYVPHVARRGQIKHSLNNSFGFGGTNACLIFSKI